MTTPTGPLKALLPMLASLALACDGTEPQTVEPAAPPRLDPAEATRRTLRPGEIHHYTVALAEGDFLELRVDQQGIDVVTTLREPSGEALAETDRPIEYQSFEPLLAVAPATAEFGLEVRAFEAHRPPGTYSLRILTQRPATDRDRLRTQATAMLKRGVDLMRVDRLDPAIEALHSALELCRESEDRFWQAETLNRLATAYSVAGRYDEAVDLFLRSSDLFSGLRLLDAQALALLRAGEVLYRNGRVEEAKALYVRSLELPEREDTRLPRATAYNNLGQAYRVQGQMREALVYYRRALDLWDHELNAEAHSLTTHNLGVLYRILGEPELAVDQLRTAEAAWSELGEQRLRATSLNQLGRVMAQRGEHPEALRFFYSALEVRRALQDRTGTANSLIDIGSSRIATRQPALARENLLEALEVLRTLERPRVLAKVQVALGSLYLEDGQAEDARRSFAESDEIYASLADPSGQAESLLGLSRAEAALGNLETARRVGRRALELVEQVRLSAISPKLRSSFFSTVQHFFDHQIGLLMESHRREPAAGHAAEAFHTSERARARSLVETLAEQRAGVRRGVEPDLLQRESTLQNRLNQAAAQRLQLLEQERFSRRRAAELETELRQIATALDELRAEIRARSPRYAALTQPRSLTLSQIQRQVVDAETLLLHYELGHQRSFLWLIGPQSFSSHELPGRDRIEPLVRRSLALLEKSHRPESAAASMHTLCELGRLLLGPVREQLTGKRLAIVADEVLQYLPFAALPRPRELPECSGSPLVLDHQIAYLPSATALATLRAEQRARPTTKGLIAVVADPVFSRADPRVTPQPPVASPDRVARDGSPGTFIRLPFSRREALDILSLAPNATTLRMLDFEASRESVVAGRLSGYRIVHFATHGIVDAAHPELSGIVLSQVTPDGGPVDGFVRTHDLYNLELPADLVVLSACRTALGKEIHGEGMVSLSRGFMYAGAARLLASLWKVSDRRTNQLMVDFYRHLLVDRLEPAEALRRAQISMWQRQPAPYYWAPFVLQGEWSPDFSTLS